MGMDLTGLKPAKRAGEYFYNNVWYWIPLWEYIASECSDVVTERDITLGGSNSGHRISRAKAEAIGRRLHDLHRRGKTQVYAKRLRRTGAPRSRALALVVARRVLTAVGAREEKPRFSLQNVREFADFCRSSGGFQID
jgi:hypothetical protein